MKKGLTLILSLIFLFACQRDPYKLIQGNWEIQQSTIANLDQYLQNYKQKFNATDSEINLEKQRIEHLPESYYPQGIVMTFSDSSKFYMGGIEGRWSMSPDKKSIEVHFSSIDTAHFDIKSINRKNLTLIYPIKFSNNVLEIELKLKRVNNK